MDKNLKKMEKKLETNATLEPPLSSNPLVIELVDSISRDERGFPLTQYITNGEISQARYTITHFKHTIVFYG